MPFYVVNAGSGRSSTHIVQSNSPELAKEQRGVVDDVAIGFSGVPKYTLCGLQATRLVNVFAPDGASCRECKKRWKLAKAAEAAAQQRVAREEAAWQQTIRDRERRQRATCQAQYEARTDQLIPALPSGKTARPGRCQRCGRRKSAKYDKAFGARWFPDGSHLDVAGARWCPGRAHNSRRAEAPRKTDAPAGPAQHAPTRDLPASPVRNVSASHLPRLWPPPPEKDAPDPAVSRCPDCWQFAPASHGVMLAHPARDGSGPCPGEGMPVKKRERLCTWPRPSPQEFSRATAAALRTCVSMTRTPAMTCSMRSARPAVMTPGSPGWTVDPCSSQGEA